MRTLVNSDLGLFGPYLQKVLAISYLFSTGSELTSGQGPYSPSSELATADSELTRSVLTNIHSRYLFELSEMLIYS